MRREPHSRVDLPPSGFAAGERLAELQKWSDASVDGARRSAGLGVWHGQFRLSLQPGRAIVRRITRLTLTANNQQRGFSASACQASLSKRVVWSSSGCSIKRVKILRYGCQAHLKLVRSWRASRDCALAGHDWLRPAHNAEAGRDRLKRQIKAGSSSRRGTNLARWPSPPASSGSDQGTDSSTASPAEEVDAMSHLRSARPRRTISRRPGAPRNAAAGTGKEFSGGATSARQLADHAVEVAYQHRGARALWPVSDTRSLELRQKLA